MTLFGDEFENEIKKSILYFLSLRDADRISVLTAPVSLSPAHGQNLSALWAAIMNKMALHEKHQIVDGLVELGLDGANSAILVDSLIDKAPTPVYTLKVVIRSIGEEFVSMYPKIVDEWRRNGKDELAISKKLGLSTQATRSTLLATNTLLNEYARGMPPAVLREYMHDAGIPNNIIDTTLQILNTHYKQWMDTGLFVNMQETLGLATRAVTQNEVILDTLKKILEALRGRDPGDQSYVQ